MKPLTPKQEKFAQVLADGKSQAEAYRIAFDVSPTARADTAQKRASELMTNPDVSGRVAELREALSQKALWTREDSVRQLLEVIKDHDRKSDVIAAIKELNLMHGYNAPQKIDIMGVIGIQKIERVVIKPTDGS